MSDSSSPKKTNWFTNFKQKNISLNKSPSNEVPDKTKGNKGSYVTEYNKYLKSSSYKSNSILYLNLAKPRNNQSAKTILETASSTENNSISNTSCLIHCKSGKFKHAHSLGPEDLRNGKRAKQMNHKYKDLCCTHKYARMYGINYTSPLKKANSRNENFTSCKSR
jgi:hypothetical protein